MNFVSPTTLKAGVKHACAIASRALDLIEKTLTPGMTTEDIDQICIKYIHSQGGKSGCLGYRGYPKYTCVSVNEVMCHGIPGSRIVNDGDLVNVDIVVECEGFYGDTARTFCLGNVSAEARRLSEATREARDAGIKVIKPGIMTGDIGFAIQSYVSQTPFRIAKDFSGHGIGLQMHEPPSIKSYGQPGQGVKLREGMLFTVEPILCANSSDFTELDDGWTIVTKDGGWAAQWEHTICVTSNGYEILSW